MLQVEGTVVPVIDLRTRFELPHAPLGVETRTMVVEADGAALGAMGGAVLEVLRPSTDAVAPPPPVVRGLAATCVQGVITLPSRTVAMLHAGRLLNSAERIMHREIGAETAHG